MDICLFQYDIIVMPKVLHKRGVINVRHDWFNVIRKLISYIHVILHTTCRYLKRENMEKCSGAEHRSIIKLCIFLQKTPMKITEVIKQTTGKTHEHDDDL